MIAPIATEEAAAGENKIRAKPKPDRRDKYNADYARQAKILCERGADHRALAAFFRVSPRTIGYWKEKRKDFQEAMREGKLDYDTRVERGLYERARGYCRTTDTVTKTANGKTEVTTIVKEYPPDTVSMIFWLKNRQPARWRDRHEHAMGDMDGQPLFKPEVIAAARAIAAKL